MPSCLHEGGIGVPHTAQVLIQSLRHVLTSNQATMVTFEASSQGFPLSTQEQNPPSLHSTQVLAEGLRQVWIFMTIEKDEQVLKCLLKRDEGLGGAVKHPNLMITGGWMREQGGTLLILDYREYQKWSVMKIRLNAKH